MSGTGLILSFQKADKPSLTSLASSLSIKIPPDILAPLPTSLKFNNAAADPLPEGRGQPHDTTQLWQEVLSQDGQVAPEKARQFVDDFINGAFTRDSRISDKRTNDFSSLGFDTLINLYEAIASEKTKGMSIYLQEINKALELGKDFYEERVKPCSKFFDNTNKPWLEQKWQDAKNAGQIANSEPSFADTMAELMGRPELTSKDDLTRRMKTLQFICDAYSEFVGETSMAVKVFNGDPALRGFHANKAQAKEEIIGLNVYVVANLQTAIGVLMHERQHASQDRLAQALKEGKIQKGDPDYLAARIFAANRDNNGYINPAAKAGHWGYRFQPLEIDAHNAGFLAEFLSYKNFAKKPDIIHKPKGDDPDLKAA